MSFNQKMMSALIICVSLMWLSLGVTTAKTASLGACDYKRYPSSGCRDELGAECDTASDECRCKSGNSVVMQSAFCFPKECSNGHYYDHNYGRCEPQRKASTNADDGDNHCKYDFHCRGMTQMWHSIRYRLKCIDWQERTSTASNRPVGPTGVSAIRASFTTRPLRSASDCWDSTAFAESTPTATPLTRKIYANCTAGEARVSAPMALRSIWWSTAAKTTSTSNRVRVRREPWSTYSSLSASCSVSRCPWSSARLRSTRREPCYWSALSNSDSKSWTAGAPQRDRATLKRRRTSILISW